MADEYLDVNLDDLRIREIEEIEDLLGAAFDDAFAPGKPHAKALRAVACVMKRRENPDFTMEDAGELIIRMPEADPTQANA